MAYSRIYIQTVFAVQGREALIQPDWEEQLFRYITGIVQNKKQKMLAINGMPDHLHFLIGMKPSCCLSNLVQEIKKSSNEFIKENRLSKFKFNWQEEFGAFSYGHKQLDDVIAYIMNQKTHHSKKTFKQEYYDMLSEYKIEFNNKYLFEWYE